LIIIYIFIKEGKTEEKLTEVNPEDINVDTPSPEIETMVPQKDTEIQEDSKLMEVISPEITSDVLLDGSQVEGNIDTTLILNEEYFK